MPATKASRPRLAIADDLPALVAGDALRLRAVLENLADNAVKFTHEGAVVFTAGAKPAGRKRVYLMFTVADTGIGIDARDIKNLFRPFAQASEAVARRYGGAGLGLVFVKRVAEAMGGDLRVTSKPGHGTSFRLSVPVDRVEAGAQAERAGAPATASRALSILCAEDNPYGRVVMNTILTELGHRANFVESGEAAVDAVSRGSYDAVLMDVVLAGLDGIAATRRIRALPGKAGRIPVIGISGRSEERRGGRRARGRDEFLFHEAGQSQQAGAGAGDDCLADRPKAIARLSGYRPSLNLNLFRGPRDTPKPMEFGRWRGR